MWLKQYSIFAQINGPIPKKYPPTIPEIQPAKNLLLTTKTITELIPGIILGYWVQTKSKLFIQYSLIPIRVILHSGTITPTTTNTPMHE